MRAFVLEHVNTDEASLYTDEYKAYMGMGKVTYLIALFAIQNGM